jgi:hypothetical protein
MTYERVTFLFSLPRSGTQWLTWLYGHATTAWHDPLKNCASIRELKEKVDAVEGRLFIADTSALLFYDQIVEAFPGAQRLYLHRPLPEVMKSIVDNGGVYSPEILQAMYSRLEGAAFYGETVWAFEDLHLFAQHYWQAVTNRDCPDNIDAYFHWIIDKPLPEQYRLINHAKARRLFAQREIAR